MIEVEAPGGVIVEFPDGTPPEVMTRAMRSRFGGPPAPAAAQPLGPITDAATGNPFEPPPVAPQPMMPGLSDGPGLESVGGGGPSMRQGKLAGQAVGSGVADLAAMPFDIPTLAKQGIEWGLDKGMTALGAPAKPADAPELPLMSDLLKAGATKTAEFFGYQPVKPESFDERLQHNVINMGTQGLAGGVALAKAAAKRVPQLLEAGVKPRLGDRLIEPYLKNPTKAVAGDTIAGGSAGAALTGSQELPEEYRSSLGGATGPLTDLAAMLIGGVGGGVATELVTGTPSTITRMARDNSISRDIPIDQGTGKGTTNRAADIAAKHVQGQAIDPDRAAANIENAVRDARAEGMPLPTTGPISGDTGIIALEQGKRAQHGTETMMPGADPATKSDYNFQERDTRLRDQAVDDVNSLRPDGANPQAFPDRADEIVRMRREAAQREVDQNAGAVRGIETARQAPANDLNANVMQGEGASAGINQTVRQTRVDERNQSNALFNDPELVDALVPAQPLVGVTRPIAAADTQAAPIAPIVRKYTERFAPHSEDNPAGFQPDQQITMREVNALRAEVEADIAANLDNGQIVQQLREIKNVINTYGERLAAQGGPAGVAAAEATENYATRVAPNFRQGAGGRVDQTLKSDPNSTGVLPSKMAENFLVRSEDTADLMRIAQLGGNEAQTAAQARTWLFDRLAQSGVARDGAIDPEKLTRWRNANAGVLRNVPGLEAEVNGMVREARRGAALTDERAAGLRAAEQRAAQVERDISDGPLGKVAGASPEKAVAAVFGHKNPEAAARELMATVGKNPEARAGIKAAFAEHLANQVSGVAPANVSHGSQNVNYAALVKHFNKHQRVLQEIFTPEEMNSLRRAQRMLEPLAQGRAQATTGSITAEKSVLGERALRLGLYAFYGNALKAGGAAARLKDAWKTLKGEADEIGANRLVARMMFDPELAQHLLTRKVADVGTPAWNARLQKIIRRTEAAKQFAAPDDEE